MKMMKMKMMKMKMMKMKMMEKVKGQMNVKDENQTMIKMMGMGTVLKEMSEKRLGWILMMCAIEQDDDEKK